MSLRVHEVRLARVRLRVSNDVRPCVILEEPQGGRVKVFPISSTLYDPYKHFLISASSPDFAATGLLKESYVQEVVAELDVADIGHRLGELTGEILEDFRRWSWF